MSLLYFRDRGINIPCRASFGQVPAVVMAVEHAILGPSTTLPSRDSGIALPPIIASDRRAKVYETPASLK